MRVQKVFTKCVGCGEGLRHHPRQRNPKKWCSDACRVKHYRANNPEYRERSRRLNAQRKRDLYVPVKNMGGCVYCGKRFAGKRRDAKYCSQSCANRAYNERRRTDGRAAEMSANRRALERGAKVQGGRRESVLNADGYVCHLCGELTDPHVAYPHPQYPVIDHVVPLSHGGDHGPENWRTAHNICNSRRRALSVEEFKERFL